VVSIMLMRVALPEQYLLRQGNDHCAADSADCYLARRWMNSSLRICQGTATHAAIGGSEGQVKSPKLRGSPHACQSKGMP